MANGFDDGDDDDAGMGHNGGPEFIFEEAERKNIKALVMFFGESGSGKTKSALRFAEGLDPGGVIGLVDTEAGRGRHYANEHRYKYTELQPPFSPARYKKVIEAAKKQGVTTLIIDSITHVHEGQGGLMDMAEAVGGDSFNKWKGPKREWKKLRDYILHCGMHIVFCARAKDPLEKDPNDSRKMIRGKLIPIVPRGFAFEITVSLGLDAETHAIIPVKLSNEIAGAFPLDEYISENSGKMVRAWLDGGEVVDHRFEEMKDIGRDMARGGKDRLKAWSDSLDPKMRARLKPFIVSELIPLSEGAKPQTAGQGGGGKEANASRSQSPPPPPPPPAAPPPPPKKDTKPAAQTKPAQTKQPEPPPADEDDGDPGPGDDDRGGGSGDDLELDFDAPAQPARQQAATANRGEKIDKGEDLDLMEILPSSNWMVTAGEVIDQIELHPTRTEAIRYIHRELLKTMQAKAPNAFKLVERTISEKVGG